MTVVRAKMEITMNTMRKLPHNNNTNEERKIIWRKSKSRSMDGMCSFSGTRASAIYYNYFLLPSACKKLF